jgi:hypothetical protein
MTLDELLARMATEPDRDAEREVRVMQPALRREWDSSADMTPAELLSDPRWTIEWRKYRTGHVVGPPATEYEIDRWRRQRPHHEMPADLLDLVRRANGIHLWAELDASRSGRSYQGLAPIADWDFWCAWMRAPPAEVARLARRHLAVTYEDPYDKTDFVALNTESGESLPDGQARPARQAPDRAERRRPARLVVGASLRTGVSAGAGLSQDEGIAGAVTSGARRTPTAP